MLQQVVAVVERAEPLARATARSARVAGWAGLAAATVAWLVVLQPWNASTGGSLALRLAVLGLLLMPGLTLLHFSYAITGVAEIPQRLVAQLDSTATSAFSSVRAVTSAARQTGGAARRLVATLRELFRLRQPLAEARAVAGSALRVGPLANPAYLLAVAGSAAAVGFLALVAVVAVIAVLL